MLAARATLHRHHPLGTSLRPRASGHSQEIFINSTLNFVEIKKYLFLHSQHKREAL
jgi:hypothetical protein